MTTPTLSWNCPSLPLPLSSLTIDPAQLDTRGPCSKYELDIAEGKFKGKIKFILEGGILRVSHTP